MHSLLVSNLGARWGCVINPTPGLFTAGKKAMVPHCAGGWVGSRVRVDGYGKQSLADTGVRNQDLPASSKLVHWLRYSGLLCLLLGSPYYLVHVSYFGANTRLSQACFAHETCATVLSYVRWE